MSAVHDDAAAQEHAAGCAWLRQLLIVRVGETCLQRSRWQREGLTGKSVEENKSVVGLS